MVSLDEIERGDELYWARILPRNKIKEVILVKIITIKENHCVGCDMKTKQSYIIVNHLFRNGKGAKAFLKQPK